MTTIEDELMKLKESDIFISTFLAHLIEYFDKTEIIPRKVLRQMVVNAREQAEKLEFPDTIDIEIEVEDDNDNAKVDK